MVKVAFIILILFLPRDVFVFIFITILNSREVESEVHVKLEPVYIWFLDYQSTNHS